MSTAREAALDALAGLRRGSFSTDALPAAISAAGLDRRDAALCERIVLSTVQNLIYIDFVIGRWCSTPVKKLETAVLDILRVSCAQLLYMDRIPSRAAVSEGVELCRKRGRARAAGLVNGVLRRIAENRDNPPEPADKDTELYLSTKYSHPLWLTREFALRRGNTGAEALLASDNAEPPLTLQVNTLRTDSGRLLQAFKSAGFEAVPGLLPDSFDLAAAGDVTALPGYAGGHFYVQDAAARMAVEAAAPQKGMRVLDACSAPGGKSFAAAIRMGGEGSILACDLKEKRLKRVSEGAKRLGLDMIETRAMDARKPGEELRGAFDVVIADAPCSGLGVIRRKPEIRYKSPDELSGLPEIQLDILRGLAGCVKPGGTLLYSTCTLLERENEDVVRAFLSEEPDFTVEIERTLWPDIDKTDGFFICRMVKSI